MRHENRAMSRLDRPRTWLIPGIIVVGTAALAIAFMPLRLVTGWLDFDARGISARQVSGTIWSGRIDQLRVGTVPMGTLDTGLHPLDLLLGRVTVGFTRINDPAAPLSGSLSLRPGGYAISDLSGSIIGGSVADLPIERVTFDQFNAQFGGGRCVAASGQVRIMLAVRFAGLALRNGLGGAARCDGGNLLLPLTGDSGLERATLRLSADRRYRLQFGVSDPDPLVAAALAAGGFVNRGGAWVREVAGQF